LFFILLGVWVLLGAVEARPYVSAVDQFTADFIVTTKYNVSFQNQNIPDYNPIPFLQSPTLLPIQGKIWFNYQTAEFRIDFFNGEGSPMKFYTSVIANSYNFVRAAFSFNCTTDFYTTAGKDRCWYANTHQPNMPAQMGGEMNLTYNGTRNVDGYDCMVFLSNSGFLFAIRLLDLAVVEVDLPYFVGEVAPIFNFFGWGNALTRVTLSNIVAGPPDPSNFSPPQGACLQIYNDTTLIDHSKDPLKSLFNKDPVADLVNFAKKTFFPDTTPKEEPMDKKRLFRPGFAPHLNQTFSANWILNASQTNYPYTPYTFSGTLGWDFTISGFMLSIDSSTGNIPFDIQTSFHIYPDRNGVELLQVGPDNSCYSYIYFQWIFTLLLPIFEVPWDATYQGSVTVNGDTCSVYQTNWFYSNAAVLYVRDSDHVVVESLIPDPLSWAPNARLIFSNVKGAVPPSTYGRPPVCEDLLNWSSNFASHLPWDWCEPYC